MIFLVLFLLLLVQLLHTFLVLWGSGVSQLLGCFSLFPCRATRVSYLISDPTLRFHCGGVLDGFLGFNVRFVCALLNPSFVLLWTFRLYANNGCVVHCSSSLLCA